VYYTCRPSHKPWQLQRSILQDRYSSRAFIVDFDYPPGISIILTLSRVSSCQFIFWIVSAVDYCVYSLGTWLHFMVFNLKWTDNQGYLPKSLVYIPVNLQPPFMRAWGWYWVHLFSALWIFHALMLWESSVFFWLPTRFNKIEVV